MPSSRMKYGAVYAKVMALHGKMLKDEDWRRLYECKSVQDICAVLRTHRGWGQTVSELPPSPSPRLLQTAVRKRLYEDYEKIYNYLLVEDKKYLRLYLYRAEYELILDAVREKCSYERLPKSSAVTDFIREHSSVDVDALEQSKNFQGVLSAVRGSIFEKPLSELKLNPETGMPSYWEAGILLENVYYKAVFSYISTRYNGMGKKKLTEALGSEADFLNIISIIRLHRNFPASLGRADELLVPISYRLSPELLASLRDAKSENEVLEILHRSTLAKRLEGVDMSDIDGIYNKSMEKLCRRLMKAAEPDMGVPQAYLILKDMECGRLMRVIEAVSCGVDPRSAVQ